MTENDFIDYVIDLNENVINRLIEKHLYIPPSKIMSYFGYNGVKFISYSEAHYILTHSMNNPKYEEIKQTIIDTLEQDEVYYNTYVYLKDYYKRTKPKSSINIHFKIITLWYNYMFKDDTVTQILKEIRKNKLKKIKKNIQNNLDN